MKKSSGIKQCCWPANRSNHYEERGNETTARVCPGGLALPAVLLLLRVSAVWWALCVIIALLVMEGKGKTQPITKPGDCIGPRSRKLIACLQPDLAWIWR